MPAQRGAKFILSVREFNGALGDLGTLLPLTLGTVAVVGLAPTPALIGFALCYIGTAFYYRLPIPVQPMKAVAAVLLTAGIAPAGLAASGVMIGLVLLVLGLTGWITRLARIVPQSVLAGLQLGLGVTLALLSLKLMATAPLIGMVTFSILLALLILPRLPSALIGLLVAVVMAHVMNVPGMTFGATPAALVAIPPWPSLSDIERAFTQFALPQLALTFTNAVLLTALVAGDYFKERAAHATPARLSISNGLANLILSPLGALPMCHGAGGLAAHYRFGARSGTAPLILGVGLLGFALLPGDLGLAALAAIPVAGLGALLLFTSSELAFSKRLFDYRPSCWPVIAITAAATVATDPFWGLLAGGFSEYGRVIIMRALQRDARD